MNERLLGAVFLVHGLIGPVSDPDLLDVLGPRLALAPDLLGYGDLADVFPERIALAAQVHHLRKRLSDGKVHLVGHSVCGVVS